MSGSWNTWSDLKGNSTDRRFKKTAYDRRPKRKRINAFEF
jgi:hypothetical protein